MIGMIRGLGSFRHIIADLVREDELVKLYAVNSAFFHRAMVVIYGEVHISHLEDEQTLRCIKNFGPVVAPYVKSLVISPHDLGYFMNRAVGITGVASEAVWLVKKSVNGKAIPSGGAAARILLRNVSRMTNVRSLKIIHSWSDDYPYFLMALPLIRSALLASGTRIRELSLDLPVESYEHVFPPDLNLIHLDTLNVTMHNQPFLGIADYAEHLAATLAPFISRHFDTIKHISVDVPYRQATVDLSAVFIGFRDRLPNLTSLSISVPLEYLYKPGFHVPLENHSESLEDLKLILYPPFLRQDVLLPPQELFSLGMFKIAFPSLKLLDLDLWMWPEAERQSATKRLVNYLLPMQGTLSTLILRHYRFSAGDLCSIFHLHPNIFPRLSRLQICVRYLSVEVFDILSTCLPKLSRLSISFDGLGENTSDFENNQTSQIHNVRMFADNMKTRQYGEWKLQDIELSLLGNAAGKWNDCQSLIVQSLPNLLAINGMRIHY